MAGAVRVGGEVADKPGLRVAADAEIEVAAAPKYVGRGGLKLEAALDHFAIDPKGWICLDIGASTGGFTDCLLQRGAARVYAVDVGHSQLAWSIRSDPRVVVKERLNARALTAKDVPEQPQMAVFDVSFISLTLVLPPALELLTAESVAVALIKPQFELSREDVGKGGIVRDPALRWRAVEKIERFVRETLRAKWEGVIESPIPGAEGNREFLACLRK